MKIAITKFIEVPDGISCTREIKPRPILHGSYCGYIHFSLWNIPKKEKKFKCNLFDQNLEMDENEEPLKCKQCLESEARHN